jgi:hypothetical protein
MTKISSLPAFLAAFLLLTSSVGAAPFNKCVVKGAVTYQQGPCPSDQVRQQPTVQELNAEESRRRAAAAAAPSAKAAPAAAKAGDGFSCDTRRYCSQMTSCAEARYFLANCPGVKMDGNKDGTPCEKQWCSR